MKDDLRPVFIEPDHLTNMMIGRYLLTEEHFHESKQTENGQSISVWEFGPEHAEKLGHLSMHPEARFDMYREIGSARKLRRIERGHANALVRKARKTVRASKRRLPALM